MFPRNNCSVLVLDDSTARRGLIETAGPAPGEKIDVVAIDNGNPLST